MIHTYVLHVYGWSSIEAQADRLQAFLCLLLNVFLDFYIYVYGFLDFWVSGFLTPIADLKTWQSIARRQPFAPRS
jgi:hypothetical protein